jgi:hypothetical protein
MLRTRARTAEAAPGSTEGILNEGSGVSFLSDARAPSITEFQHAVTEEDFKSGTNVLSGKDDFVILSYVSRAGSGREAGSWARCHYDQRKLIAAYNFIRERHNGEVEVWVDKDFDPATSGHERYGFSPFRTLGGIYRHARYTLSILEGHDADWLDKIAQLEQEYDLSQRDRARSFARRWLKDSRVEQFNKLVAKHKYSYWNRAWIAQEIFQSRSILYCRYDYQTGKVCGIISSHRLATVASVMREYVEGGRYHSLEGSNALHRATMISYLRHALPASWRALIVTDYDAQADVISFITSHVLHAGTRTDALAAVAILLGLDVLPVEQALARAVHHEMVRRGRLPLSDYQSAELQTFANSSWASRRSPDPEGRNTEELQTYVATPVPVELQPDGSLLVVTPVVNAVIEARHSEAETAPRQIRIGGDFVTEVRETALTAPPHSVEACLLSMVSVMVVMNRERTHLYGIIRPPHRGLPPNDSVSARAGVGREGWRVTVTEIR